MATTASLTPAERAASIYATPLNLLLYLYEAQLRLAWLQGTIDTLQQQGESLQTLASASGTPAMVADLARGAIESGTDERNQLVAAGMPLQHFRDDLERAYRNRFPAETLGPTDVGGGSTDRFKAVQVASLIARQAGMPAQFAAFNLPPGLPRVTLFRLAHHASVLRNSRLLRRFGSPTQAADASNLEPESDFETRRLRTYQAAYRASWTTQSKLFENGFLVRGNTNLRRWIFRDRSYVEIQAHLPALTRSDDSQFSRVSAVSAVAATGCVLAGAIGAGVGLAKSLASIDTLYPEDAAWQGYTIRYFQNEHSTQPWATRYFYGWKRSHSVAHQIQIQGSSDAQNFSNFADAPERYTWWKWAEHNADVAPYQRASSTTSIATAAQKLMESLAGNQATGHATLVDSNTPIGIQIGHVCRPHTACAPWQQDRSFLRFG